MQRPDAFRRSAAELASLLAPRPSPSREVAAMLAAYLGTRRGASLYPAP